MYYLTPYNEMLGFSSLSSYPNIFNFTTTRSGGVSQDNYASLNCSYYSGDVKQSVDENWAKVLSYTNIQPNFVIRPFQTHEDRVLGIDASFLELSAQEQEAALQGVDGLITNIPKVLLTVATADCVPVTLYDPTTGVVAVVHAGWRGTVKKILQKTIQLAIDSYGCNPANLLVCIGPSISLKNFEVGPEVVEEFEGAGFELNKIICYNQSSQKHHIDLWKANALLALECGIPSGNISVANICTYQRDEEFFSARRLGINSGRIVTGIMLKK